MHFKIILPLPLILLLARKIVELYFFNDDLDGVLISLKNEETYLTVHEADYGIEYNSALLEPDITAEKKNDIETEHSIISKNYVHN